MKLIFWQLTKAKEAQESAFGHAAVRQINQDISTVITYHSNHHKPVEKGLRNTIFLNALSKVPVWKKAHYLSSYSNMCIKSYPLTDSATASWCWGVLEYLFRSLKSNNGASKWSWVFLLITQPATLGSSATISELSATAATTKHTWLHSSWGSPHNVWSPVAIYSVY